MAHSCLFTARDDGSECGSLELCGHLYSFYCAVLCVYVSVQKPYVGRLVQMSLNQLGEVRHDAPPYKKHCDIIH